ncbi:hypothetical protein [Methyloterricola oryzae]|uniref:hypothetical protein n=1 Tax=Methyloterricola oryzae TaxID=1495050 RepID=UPI00069C0615|nr:hypothetical protein [Methyloterricola oryzae]
MRASDRLIWLLSAALAFAASQPGRVAAEPVKGDAALLQTLRKAQNMLRELNQDKTALDAANAALTQQVQDLQARLKAAESREIQIQRLEAHVQAQHRENESLRQRIASDAERLQAGTARSRALMEELARWRRDNSLLLRAVDERTRWGNACLAKNRDLIRLNRKVLEHQGEQGFWDRLKAVEPLTGLGRVAEENARDEFGYRLEDLEVTPWREPAGTAESGPSGSTATDEEEEDEQE